MPNRTPASPSGLWLGCGHDARERDLLLTRAWAGGGRDVVWFDLAAGLGERYLDPVGVAGEAGAAGYRRRQLLWPGDLVVWRGRLRGVVVDGRGRGRPEGSPGGRG